MIQIDSILDVEKHIDDVEAVIFDLDDTLYSEKEYVRSGYRKIAGDFGIPEMENELFSAFASGTMAIDEVLMARGLMERKDAALKIYRHQEPDIHAYDGVPQMLERIRISKRTGIITDGRPEGQRAKLQALGLKVDEVIITDELGGIAYRKPCALAFELMSQRLGVPFDRMVYIGDNTKKDFIAPEKLGMKWIWFNNSEGLYR